MDKHYMNIVYCSTEQTALLALLRIINRWLLSPTNKPDSSDNSHFRYSPSTMNQTLPATPHPSQQAHYHAEAAHQQDVQPTQGRRGRIRSSKQRLSLCRPNMLCRAIHSLGWVHSLHRENQTLTTPWRALRDVTSDNTTVVGLGELQPNKNDVEKSQLAWRTHRIPRCKQRLVLCSTNDGSRSATGICAHCIASPTPYPHPIHFSQYAHYLKQANGQRKETGL
jgi:hypothetical protein